MRWNIPAGVLMALAFLIPAAPAVAQTGSPGPNEACQTVERKVYKDIHELVTIDLDTASNTDVRVLAAQILAAANADSLATLPDRMQERLDGTADDLRAFLKTDLLTVWSTDLRLEVVRTLTGAGANVKAAAQDALDEGTIDAYLAYLNNGLYVARALDCATASPSASASTSPSPSVSVAPIPASSTSPGASGGEGGGLPVTGAGTATLAGIGSGLLLLGGAGYVIARRRRTRFAA
jgi:LPXTG-motif cell wall-anchored protein